ncbi:WASH complex subunit 2 isoform X2 [Ictalurus furcatus]|uniref:WASH complex subunit 2 isoform X2 n=1 Tax=Ictalurus furcatus TaxID=66913 RepID=UPI00235027DB|nr:WASH complex subunit 2 isoform X2 [Ictalurus furcatus]
MAEHMENGPSNCNGEAEQVWERPWTLDEMRKNSASWSLAADSGLFLYLQDFSQWMLSKTHEIEKQLDGLIRDTKATDSCLHTVFNEFLMLSNIQFIENRVYDEEVEEPVPKTEAQEKHPEQEKTREQKEAELIPKVQEAVNYGLKVLESAFEQLDVKVGNSDSEDEEAADRVEPILEPKDLYIDRPLPYLIGSQVFMEQDDVGLGDLSSDEMSIDSDRESFVESEVDKDQEEHSDEDFDQERESQGSLKKKPVSSDEEEENEDSDLFGESDKDEDEARRDDVGPASFADQLAARIKDATKKPETDRTSLSSGTSVTKRKNQGKKLPEARVEDEDEMFKPPKMEDDEYSPFGGNGGLFSGGKGLFDDDEQGDLFSEAPKKEKEQGVSKKTEHVNTKKPPTGAVSIFPENRLFGSPNGSDSLESKENDSPVKSKVQAARKQTSLGSGLFDDNEDDDDFFSGKTLKKPTFAAQEKAKPKTTADLFGGEDDDDDEDGDFFGVGSRSAISQQRKKVVEEEEVVKPPEKKLPAGAISMFGPGTNSLLAESLKKRHPSTSEESVKSEESIPPPVVKPSVVPKTTAKAQSKSLFSDDEDSQIFPTVPKSQSKPEGPAQNKPSKAAISIFDDEEEEESDQIKTAVPQPKKSLSSALFSDDEDQWMSSQPSPAVPDVKSGGMKASTSAPSRLPSAKAPQKDGLFDDHDDDDLFAATKEPSQKKPQRVSLLFEDEDDEDKGSLFGFKPSSNKGTPEVNVPAAASKAPSLFGPEETQEVVNVAEEKPSDKKAVPAETNKSKKPAGAVSLFGGINVLGGEAKTTTKQSKNALEDFDDLDWQKEAPPPMETKEKKATKNTFSLFDDDEEEEEPDEIPPLSTATKHTDKSTLKSQEPKTFVKSTGVFQDEELLFSQTQQRDNDPEVDLFASSAKPSAPVPSSVKPAVSTLFGEEEDDDDLFSSAKPKAPPKVPVKPDKAKHDETDKGSSTVQPAKSQKPVSLVKPKETSSRIGKLQASLAINPASLLRGAGPPVPGAVSITPDLAHSSSPRPAGVLQASASTTGLQVAAEGGINLDMPAQVTTLQNANKDRVKGALQRRPQTRAARHLAAQRSEEAHLDSPEENSALQAGSAARATSSPSAFNPIPARPSALTLPITTSTTTMPAQTHTDGAVRPKILLPAEEDLFSSEDLFASVSVPKHTPPPQTKTKTPEAVFSGTSKKKEPAMPVFNDHSEELFAKVKPKPVKKAKAVPFHDDDDDIFGTEKKDSTTLAGSIKQDIFKDAEETPSKVLKKPKEQSLEASLFNDDVDIFADLTPVTKPKEKKPKKKVETKSIFDDDMDDIFSSGITKPVGASTAKKPKKPVQETNSAEESGHDIFDDPLNVFGGN